MFIASTDLIIDDSVSNLPHEFGHDPDILLVCCEAHISNAVRYLSELAFYPVEGTGMNQDKTKL